MEVRAAQTSDACACACPEASLDSNIRHSFSPRPGSWNSALRCQRGWFLRVALRAHLCQPGLSLVSGGGSSPWLGDTSRQSLPSSSRNVLPVCLCSVSELSSSTDTGHWARPPLIQELISLNSVTSAKTLLPNKRPLKVLGLRASTDRFLGATIEQRMAGVEEQVKKGEKEA